MGITNIIAKQSKKIAKKYAKLPAKKASAQEKERLYAVADFEKQEIDLRKDKVMLDFINSTDKENLKDTLKEKKELMKNYAYAARARNSVRGDLLKSSKASSDTQKKITRAERNGRRLAGLSPSRWRPGRGPETLKKRQTSNNEKKEQLTQEKLYHDDRAKDTNNNYNFFNKIIDTAGKDPEKIKELKKKTKQLNAAIKKQTKMHAKSEHSAIAALTAKHKLNRETPQTERSKLNFETKFRRSEDFKSHYEFSRNIINRYGQTETGETKELKKQFKDLKKAIKEQNGYRKNLEAGEKSRLKNNEKIDKLDTAISKIDTSKNNKTYQKMLKKRSILAKNARNIDKSNKDAGSLHDFTQRLIENASLKGDASALPKQFAALKVAAKEQTNYRQALEKTETKQLNTRFALEAINKKIEGIPVSENGKATDPKKQGQLDNLQKKQKQLNLEAIKQDRQITDATQLHEFSRKLIDNAKNAQPADPSVLPQQFAALKVAAKRQERYRDKLEGIETKLAKAEADKGKLSVKNEQRNNLKIEQLTRQQSDAKQAHEMMNELIDQASAKGTVLNLPEQCKQLREGIGGKRKFTRRPFGQERNRLNLEKAQDNQLKNKLKLDKNTTELNNLQKTLPQSQGEIDFKGVLPKDIEKIGKLTAENNKLSLIDKQSNRRIDNAAADHVIGNAFLEHVRNPKPIEPSKLKDLEQRFTDLKSAVKERDKFTNTLEKEENRQLKNSNKILSGEFQLQAEKNKLAATATNTPEYAKQESKVELQRLENKKLERRQLENALRDEKRLNNAASMQDRANNLMRSMLDPNMSNEDRAAARKEFEGLKQEAKNAKKLEKELAPGAAVRTRATFRNNLEKAEAREIKLNRRAALLALKGGNEEKIEKLKTKQAQVERQRSDSELMYSFANGLLQERQQGVGAVDGVPKPTTKEFNKQFKQLKTADKLLTEQRKNSGPEESQGYAMMKQLITEQFASDSPNTKQLATDCKNLRNGIRGTDRLERKMQKLEKRLQKDPDNLNKDRRAKDAQNDLGLGQNLIAAAMASDSKSEALAKLKVQFKALKTAIKERNKFAKNIEKLEKQSKKSEKRDARAIKRAEKQNASIERKQVRADRRLQRRQERLSKLDPEKDAKKIERLNARIERQHGRVDKLAERHHNQDAKIENLKVQEQENRRAYETRIEAAKDRHQRANNALEGLVANGNADKKEAKNAFAGLRNEIKDDVAQEKDRKKTQKAAAESTLQAKAQENSADTLNKAGDRKVAAAVQPAAPAEPAPVAAAIAAPVPVPAGPGPQPAPPEPQPIPVPQPEPEAHRPEPPAPEVVPAQAPMKAPEPEPQPVLSEPAPVAAPEPQPAQVVASAPAPVPRPAPVVAAAPAPIPPKDPKSIRVDRAGLLTSETATKQALKAAKSLDGCQLLEGGDGNYTVLDNRKSGPDKQGVVLGTISLKKNGSEMTLTAESRPGNSADSNEQFFKVAGVMAANMTPSKPKVDIEPIVTVGANVQDKEAQKESVKTAFKTADEEHKNSFKAKFKDLRDRAREKMTGKTREDRAERKSQTRPSP